MPPDAHESASRGDDGSPAIPWRTPGRWEQPLTPKMVARLSDEATTTCQLGTGCAAVILIVVAVFALVSLAQANGINAVAAVYFGGLIALAVKIFSTMRERRCRADIEGGVYIRLAGWLRTQTQESEEGPKSYSFSVAGENFPITGRAVKGIGHMDWGVVEYAPRSRIVFALRDAEGKVMYTGKRTGGKSGATTRPPSRPRDGRRAVARGFLIGAGAARPADRAGSPTADRGSPPAD